MKKQIVQHKINWEAIYQAPLNIALAKLNAPNISDYNAMNQIATALHEAIHFVYAVKHKNVVLFVAVATSPNGAAYPRTSNAKGFTADYMLSSDIGSVESHVATTIFELELDPRTDNAIAASEEKLALKCGEGIIQEARNNHNFLYANFTSNVGILNDAFDTVCNEFFHYFSPLFKTVAKAILFHRKAKDGMVSNHHTDNISQYITDYISELLPDWHYCGGIDQTIKWLSPTVKKQNDIEMKRYDKWMRENDLDTMLEIYKLKQLN